MVDDTKEGMDVPEAAEQDDSSMGEEGQLSMQGLADLRAEQERELQEDIDKYKEQHDQWEQARREQRLHDIVNAEPAEENDTPEE